MKVLILGITGSVPRRLALRLLATGYEVAGIDVRPWPGAPRDIEFHRVDVRKRAAETAFRRGRPDAVVHMATVTALSVQGEERESINLEGTKAVFDHAAAYGVKQVIFVGRHTYYGAAFDLPLYHAENEPPRGLDAFPELADLAAADLFAGTAMWRMEGATVAVLRICYTLGTPGHGPLATLLKGKRVPMVMGFDPLIQVMHEEDVVSALMLTLEKKLRGIYNVAGPAPLPLSVLVRGAGRTPVFLPGSVLAVLLGRAGFPRLFRGAVDHLKYPIVIDDSSFRRATGFAHRFDVGQTLRAFRIAAQG